MCVLSTLHSSSLSVKGYVSHSSKCFTFSIHHQYQCLYCAPRVIRFTGYGSLRIHLRAHHHISRFTESESNRFRSDGGYHHQQRHWWPSDPGYDATRYTGVPLGNSYNPGAAGQSHGVNNIPVNNNVGGTSNGDRSLCFNAVELNNFMSNSFNVISQQVERQVGHILNSASNLHALSNDPNPRRFVPIPSTNNVLVSFTNSQAPAIQPGIFILYLVFSFFILIVFIIFIISCNTSHL